MVEAVTGWVELICNGPGDPITFGMCREGDEESAAIQIARHRHDFECNGQIEFRQFVGWDHG